MTTRYELLDLARAVDKLCEQPGNELPDEVFNLAQAVKEVLRADTEVADPHVAENDPEATTADVLYAALLRVVKECEDGYWPGIGSHGQAWRALNRYRDEAKP